MARAAAAAAEIAVPAPTGYVNDRAGSISPEREAALERRLAEYEAETTHQVVVLTVPTLEGEPIERFALRVFEAWRPGHAGLDNGLLLVVAAEDRRMRVEVGYGLEGVVPDAVAARIGRDVMIPHFREGRMEEGIVAGVDALLAAARAEEIPAERRPRPSAPQSDPAAAVMFCGMAGGVLGSLFAGRRRRVRGAVFGATLSGVAAWVLLAALPWAALAAALGGLVGAGGAVQPGPGRRRGRFGWGGGFGGGGFGGGFGGGGFGGGGGRSGGGGASGSW